MFCYLLFLVKSGYQGVEIACSRLLKREAGCFGSAVVGYAVLLLPATELLLGTDDEHWAELRTGAAVPVGLDV